ncbi:hypothetical protein KAW80_03590 [Candidatus Babeliales bacterium]|nr:hypothetical protein [Candidatus Babeliales bacterium]
MNIQNLGKGAIKSPEDKRDFLYEGLMSVGQLKPFDWSKGFDVTKKIGTLKVENQNGSSSCTGQAWSKYQEILNALENVNADLSAKDIYSRIFQPQGGAYIRDGAKLLISRGVVTEKTNPSYENGQPPSEEFMRKILEGNEEEATINGSSSYATTTHNDIEWIAQMIRDNNGVVTGFFGDNEGWANADIKPPKSRSWGHCILLTGACMRNGEKAIKFINSWGEEWGENGFGYFYGDSLGEMFDIWTLVDKINIPKQKTMQLKIYQDDIYLINENAKFGWSIPDPDILIAIKKHFELLRQPLSEPVEFNPVGYYIVHGSNAQDIRSFFNIH